MVKTPFDDDEDLDSLIAQAENELTQPTIAGGGDDDLDMLFAQAEQELSSQVESEKGDYPWLKSELGKHGKEFMQDPSAGPLIKMGGDVARSINYTMGKVFEPVTQPVMGAIGKVIPQSVKEGAGKAIAGATEAFHKAVPDEGTRDLITSAGAIVGTALGAKGLGVGESTKGVAKAVGSAVDTRKIATATADKLEDFSNRMEGSIVKINTPEAKKGASNEFYSKYEVYGDANSVQQQWTDKIKADADILRTMIKEGARDQNANVNVKNVIRDARKKIVSSDASRAEKLETIKAFNEVAEELIQSYKIGDVDLLEAQKLKQYVGGKGDWLHFNGSIVKDPKMTVQAKAHNAIYDELKTTIENKGPEGIKEVNKRLSEMIPMELAARKRMLVANRNNPIPLTDYLGGLAVAGSAAHGNILPAAVMGLNMASKSGAVARGVNELSKKIRPKEVIPEGPKPITDKNRLLPYQMVGENSQPIPKETIVNGQRTVKTDMEIPVGSKIRNLGESGAPEFDYRAPPAKPAPPVPPVPKAITDRSAKALPPPMIGKATQEVQPAIASRAQRAREIDRRVAELGKVEDLKGERKLTTFSELATRHKDPFNYGDPDAKARPATEPHIYSDDPRVKDLLTPAEYRKLVKSEEKRIAANKDMAGLVDENDMTGAMTPDEFQKKAYMEYEQHMNELNAPKTMPEVEKTALVNSLVKKLGIAKNKDVVFKDLSTEKKKVILDLVNRLNRSEKDWNDFYDKGILDKPFMRGESNIHQDDIIDMINSFKGSRSNKPSMKNISTK